MTSGAAFVDLLVGQVSSPVRWDLCMASFAEAGVTGIIELAPAGALVGLAKRGLKGVPTRRREDPRRPRPPPSSSSSRRLSDRAHPTRKPSMTTPILQQSHGPAYTRIYSVGAARGENAVPNDDLVGPIDSSDEWIQQRTGIITRTRAGADVPAIDLATDAAREAIERSGVAPELIDLVIIATISNVQQTPSMAAVVADRVGANPAAAYDINAACAGYAYAVAQADALIRARRRALRARHRRREALRRRRPDRPHHLVPARRRRGRGRHRPERLRPASRRTVWGSDGSKADAVGMNATLTEFRDGERRVADAPPGGPDGLPLGGLGDGEGREAGARCRGRRRATTSPPSSPTRRTCASSTSSPSS